MRRRSALLTVPFLFYIGFEISGTIHLGTGLVCMGKWEVILRGYWIPYKVTDDVVGIISFAQGARGIGRLLDSRKP